LFLTVSLLLSAGPQSGSAPVDVAPAPVAILAGKALTLPLEGPQVINDAVVLLKDGKIEAVGPASELAVPAGYEVVDARSSWVMPGMIDLHCHVASTNFFVNDLNDGVYLTNPGLRAWTSVVPRNANLKRAVAAGVTTVLYIPGSATNMGGQGVLIKTGLDRYERMLVRNPGSLKLAQAGNPERWTIGPGRSFMNWNTRNTFKRGLAYARRWKEHVEGNGEAPVIDPQWEVFRDLLAKTTQVSTHTQLYQVVLMTITMVRQELGLDVYIDHGSFDGWKTAALAQETGVQAILGPRQITSTVYRTGRGVDTDGAIFGMAAKYQEQGHRMIGFNTDAPVIPEEELSLQSAVAVRYGFDSSNLEHVRGLTIVPATAAGIADRVGSLEPGKDADVLVVDGDPADPRSSVSVAFIEGERVYDRERNWPRW